jgi:hypothetical protein
MTSATYCLAWTPNKRGKRCGLDVADSELIMCAKHARRTRERGRLKERVEHGGHLIARDWRDNAGELRDDWYFYCAEHTQIAEPRHSMLERHIREEIDACNAERFPRCNAYAEAPVPHAAGIAWDRFKLSRNDWSHT